MTIEEKIYLEIKNRCEQPTNTYGIGAWDHHIKIVYELAKEHDVKVLAKLPIDPELASLCDKGVIELFEGDWLDALTDILEKEGTNNG